MAYNADNEVREELVKIQKNNRGDHVIATKITNKTSGSVSVDIRQYYTNADGELIPTPKGVRINAELISELINGLVSVLEPDEMMDLNDSLSDLIDGTDNSDVPSEE